MTLKILLVACMGCYLMGVSSGFYSRSYESVEETGTLPGDVQNWAIMIQNYISQVRNSSVASSVFYQLCI